LVYWMVMFFYFLTTLYQQRKNRSILFWNSMPVSDAQTVLSKLLAGLVGCQAVFLLSILALQLFFLAAFLLYGAVHGIDDLWQTFVVPSAVFARFFTLLLGVCLMAFWTLPIYGWLLLVSARARAAPFGWAVGPIAAVCAAEYLLSETTPIGSTVAGHLAPFQLLASTYVFVSPARSRGPALSEWFAELPWLELTLSGLLGLALVYAAIRFNRSEEN
ncbi:MAG: ABC-2 transporter permease, partial [Pseudomonadota bacterium]